MSEDEQWDEVRAGVLAAGESVVALLAEPAVAERWEDPSLLPEMTVGELAAHMSQMLTAAVGWLGGEADQTLVESSIGAIYGSARVTTDEGIDGEVATKIRSWARAGAVDGPSKVVARTAKDVAGLGALLPSLCAGRIVPSVTCPGAGMRADDYLRTRCVELLVHADDLASSIGVTPPSPDPRAASAAIHALLAICRERVGDLAVLRALSRPDRADPDALRAL
ncbi:MAG: maleylpyruvate isomerase N-terminal domain-containing protein [Aquihabitans sp.]